MQKSFIVSGNEIAIDSETTYSGEAELSSMERLVRKAVGLPVTKQIVFFTDEKTNSAVPVLNYQVKEFFNEWCIIEVTLANGETRSIHSSYLAEMQKPSFVTDMARQEAAL